ncbi:hypothetical protein SAMN04487905_11116 [Actinopolyspora xinjiangensis]|uniref:Uncharacterized protein n=1 Tax=Actinopolyspora xinjiangensis TaxID=405564 RepID=A0A1H0W7T2_9ACTN|nr:hypothetical protein [Actinopolyspora xinjiangensis]SDP86708.1 hypothetical protein SAMN04487905_11116 [Actinopolyspora xinjiangensis]
MNVGVPEELRSLGRLFRQVDPAPERAVGVAYGAADRLVRRCGSGVVLARVGDSAAPVHPDGASGAVPRVRTLSFAAPGRRVELELRGPLAGAFRLRGIVLSRSGQPSPSGVVTVRHGRGECHGELDSCGGFTVRDVPTGPVRLLLFTRRADGALAHRASSDWFVC